MDATLERQRPFVEAFARELAGVIERMTGEAVQRMLGDREEDGPGEDCIAWRQEFAPDVAGAGWAIASVADAIGLGRRILAAAGMGDIDDAGARATYLDLISNAFSTFSRPFGQRLGEPVSCGAGRAHAHPDGPFFAIELRHGGETTRVLARFEGVRMPEPDPEPAPQPVEGGTAPSRAGRAQALDLLLDVELPVSVSFGSADLPLKDVVKLSAGSIVELNRGLSEPVELIVNNCVIARGEVVVVEGNFAVRVLEVVSRQERLRTAI